MLKRFTFLILLMSSSFSFAQNSLFVKINDAKNGEAVSYALIQNRSQPQKLLCNEKGESVISIGDSTLLKISAIGYEDYFRFIIQPEEGDTLRVLLQQKTYELSEYVVNPYPTVALFKKAIADLQLPDTNILSPNLFMDPDLKGYAEQAKAYQPGAVLTIGLGSPITAMYNLLSKRAKSERKLQQLIYSDQRKELLAKRYNKTYVQQLLGIKKLKELEAYMEFCQPDEDFILASTDYELACYVLNCYQSFLLNHYETE